MARDVTLEIGAELNTLQVENAIKRVREPVGRLGRMLGSELAYSGEKASASMALLGETIGAITTGSFGFVALTLAVSGPIIAVKSFVEWINEADIAAQKLSAENQKVTESFRQQRVSLEEEREILNVQKQYSEASLERARTTRLLIQEEKKLQDIRSLQPEIDELLPAGEGFRKIHGEWKKGYDEQKSRVNDLNESIHLLIDKEIEEAEAKEKTIIPIKEKTKEIKNLGLSAIETQGYMDAMQRAMITPDNKDVRGDTSAISLEKLKGDMILSNLQAQEEFTKKEMANAKALAEEWSQTASIISGAFGQMMFDLAAGTDSSFKMMIRNIMLGVGQMSMAKGTMYMLEAGAMLGNPLTAAGAGVTFTAGAKLFGFGAALMAGGGLMQRGMGGSSGVSSGGGGIGSSGGFTGQGFAGSGQAGGTSSQRRSEQTVYIDRVIVIGSPDPAVGREIKKHIEAANRIGA